jgi:hypothetical protein
MSRPIMTLGGYEYTFSNARLNTTILEAEPRGRGVIKRITDASPVSSTISYNFNLAVRLHSYVAANGYNLHVPDSWFDEHWKELKPHWQLFAMRLEYWDIYCKTYSEEPIKQCITLQEVVDGTLLEGPAFAKWLKDAPYYAWQYKDTVVYQLPEEEDLQPEVLDFDGLESWFEHIHLIFWDEDVRDTEEYMFSEEYTTFPREIALERFREALKTLLEDVTINKISKNEILYELRTTSSIDDGTKGIFAMSKLKPSARSGAYEFSNVMEAYATKIPKVPGETRDGVTLEISSFNTHAWIGKHLQQVCDQIPFSAQRRIDGYLSQVVKMHDRRNFHFAKDYKKEGLLKPTIITKIIFEELHLKFPDIGFDEAGHFMTNIFYYKHEGDRDPRTPLQGHFLGMGNEITTIMSAAIHLMNLLDVGEESDIIAHFINDESLVSCNLESDILAYSEADMTNCENLGILLNKKKCYRSNYNFGFCGEFKSVNYNMQKHTRLWLNMLISLQAVNIRHAKDITNAYSQFITGNSPFSELIFQCIIDHWGYEFFEEEVNEPYRFGGWFTPFYFSHDMSLVRTSNSNLAWRAAKALTLNNLNPPKRIYKDFKVKKKSVHPLMRGYRLEDEQLIKDYTKGILSIEVLFGDPNTVIQSLGVWKRKHNLFKEAYFQYEKRLISNYNDKKPYDQCELVFNWTKQSSNIMPTPNFYKEYKGDVHGIYMNRYSIPNAYIVNPISSAINFLIDEGCIDGSYIEDVVPSIRPLENLKLNLRDYVDDESLVWLPKDLKSDDIMLWSGNPFAVYKYWWDTWGFLPDEATFSNPGESINIHFPDYSISFRYYAKWMTERHIDNDGPLEWYNRKRYNDYVNAFNDIEDADLYYDDPDDWIKEVNFELWSLFHYKVDNVAEEYVSDVNIIDEIRHKIKLTTLEEIDNEADEKHFHVDTSDDDYHSENFEPELIGDDEAELYYDENDWDEEPVVNDNSDPDNGEHYPSGSDNDDQYDND